MREREKSLSSEREASNQNDVRVGFIDFSSRHCSWCCFDKFLAR